MLKKLSNKEYNQHTSNLYRLGYTKINQFINSKYRNILLKKVNEKISPTATKHFTPPFDKSFSITSPTKGAARRRNMITYFALFLRWWA